MKKGILLSLILVAAVLLSACGSGKTSAEAAQATEPDYLIAEGSLLPVKALDISFSVSGQVHSVEITDGQSVRTDQVLARLDDVPEADAALAKARQDVLDAQVALDDYKASGALNLAQGQLEVILSNSKYKNARDNFLDGRSTERKARMDEAEANLKLAEDAYAQLEDNEGLDPDQLDALEARLASAQASLASAQAAVDALTLRASMNGTVVDVAIIPGQQVTAGELVMALADFSGWVIKTDSLTELEVVNVTEGQAVQVILDALPDTVLKGTVTNINERFEEKRGDITYTVTVQLDETDPHMRWGMTAAVYFLPPEEQGS
ncbi:HlyD family secretion protein [Pelolinea submarina]|uniref:CusB/HlyD membrane fusion family barrel-sandwich protein n=1 Tax=Pelolinea submarina TaxID=913107 RepID=A0A347ZVP2_9CHLR|nr:HlyD family efflux transporter periplasmic adaptor subunit [Pelolinea submarina]REG07068.1 CusB/HlyD membrane fusion family barrel-sandwich protein [Pelolinea submarina]BBB49373.1 HlyD family secretion protein [Pelolinea submarina]